MLAYRHAYHAGNHADVLKHAVLVRVLRHMNLKEKPYRIVDTHAGAGGYALDSEFARKKSEYADGVGRLWAREDLPESLADYLALVRAFNADGNLRLYPGSPEFADRLRRPRDELNLFELHPGDHPVLAERFAGVPGVEVRRADGFSGLAKRLPPPSRRGVILMDPSYEGLSDYARVCDAVETGLARFAEGVFLVWYPLVHNKPESFELAGRLAGLSARAPKGWLDARLVVGEPDEKGFGMVGSGMFVVNPPHTLAADLREMLPYLTRLLAQSASAHHRLEVSPT